MTVTASNFERIQWFPGETTGTEDHAWFVWGPVNREPSPPVLLFEARNPNPSDTREART